MMKPIPLITSCALLLLLGACGKKAADPAAFTSAAPPKAAPTTANSTGWDEAAARKFEQADSGAKRKFVCAVSFNSNLIQIAQDMHNQTGGRTRVLSALVSDPAIGFEALGKTQMQVEASSPRKALGLIDAGGDQMVVAEGCYDDVSGPGATADLGAATTYVAYQGNPAPYFWAQYAIRHPGAAEDQSIAKALSADYAREADVFKRQDMFKQLQPQIAATLATAKAKPYVTLLSSITVGHYDAGSNSFALTNGLSYSPASAYDFSPWIGLSLDGSPALFKLRPANQDVARAFEALVTQSDQISVRLYIKCVGIGVVRGRGPSVEGWLLRYEVVDTQGRARFTIAPDGALQAA
jgi:hypothetical protein